MNRRLVGSVLLSHVSRRAFLRRTAPVWIGLVVTISSVIPPSNGQAPWLPFLSSIGVAQAGYPCSSHSGEWPTFTGHLSNSAGTQLSETTSGDVYGRISNVDRTWQASPGCGYYRYDAVIWATTNDTTHLTVDWGSLSGDAQPCLYVVGQADYLHANSGACPGATTARLVATLSPEATYQNDSALDDKGDFAFAHSDCITPYYGSEPIKTDATTGATSGKPGVNCGDKQLDGTNTTQTLVVDGTAPAVSITWPPAGGPLIVPSAFAAVSFTATDAVAGFGGTDGWTLQRQKAAISGASSCDTTWSNDGSAVTGFTAQPAGGSSQGLALGACYRWTLWARDKNGNTSATITSGSIRTDTAAVLGDQPQFRFETWDLGGGDSLAVSTGSGNLRVTHPIVSLPIVGGTFDLAASYNSHDTTDVGLGVGWRLNVQRRLQVNADGSVTFTDADGSRHTFTTPTGTGTVTYTRPPTLYANLVRDTTTSPDRFTLTYRDQSVDVFDEDLTGVGLLKQIKDRFGNTTSLAYAAGTAKISTVTDPASRTIAFVWTGSYLSQIVDWANVSGGVVQTSGSGNRTYRFFSSGTSLTGWADPLNTSGTCPTNASHLTCLSYTNGLLTGISKLQTYETLTSGSLGTATRTITTSAAYTNADVKSVTDAESAEATFSHPAPGATKVVRPGTPASETTYALVATTDPYGRIGSVKRKLGAAQIETATTYNGTYPIEPASVTEDNGGALQRATNYTYQGSSLALLSRLDEPLDGTYRRYTDYTYNAHNDVTRKNVYSTDADAAHTDTRSCYTTGSCTTASADTMAVIKTIDNYVDGPPGGANGQAEDVTTTYQYDASGQRTRQTRANYAGSTLLDSAATGWTYDTYGNLTAEIRNYADGAVDCGTDDETPNATTNARTDVTTAYAYDTAGNRVSSADPRRAIALDAAVHCGGATPGADDYLSRTTYDALNQAVTTRLPTTPGVADCSPTPACREATTTYDELGLVREAADINDLVSATRYDKAGRAVETYEDTTADPAALTGVNTYDAQGRLLTAKDREQAKPGSTLGSTQSVYDELGRVTASTDAYGSSPDVAAKTLRSYDSLDRLVCENTGAQGTDPCATSGDGGQVTKWTFDIGGRTTKTDDEFTCATTAYDYRDLALVTSEGLDPGTCGGIAQRQLTNAYDGLGRLTNSVVTSGEGNGDVLAAPTYDSAGHQLSTAATNGTATTSSAFTFNPLDEQVAEVRSEGSPATAVSWTKSNIDAAGNVTDRCVWNSDPGTELCKPVGQSFTSTPAVQSTTAYDARNNRISLKIPGAGETTYDPAHNYQVAVVYVPTKLDATNHVVGEHRADYGYDTRHRLKTITQSVCPVDPDTHTCNGAVVATGSDTYEYDDNDNRTKVVESKDGGASTTTYYCYDALNRLVSTGSSTCTTGGTPETYVYDDGGNRTRATLSSPQYFNYSAAGQLCEQYTAVRSCGADPATWQIKYDDAGRIRLWNTWNLTYDGEGRLASACKVAGCATGDMVTMRYDADGRRIELVTRPSGGSATTTTFRYQGDAIAQELVGTGTPAVTRTYVTDESGAIVKFCDPDCTGSNPQVVVTWNGHGDALALWRINADGTLTLANSFTYSAWGQPTTATHNSYPDLAFRFLYVGRFGVAWDNALGLGLEYMSARQYSPALGRFLQPDPSSADTNLYAYVESNPVSQVDPSGLNVTQWEGAGGFSGGGGALPWFFLAGVITWVHALWAYLNSGQSSPGFHPYICGRACAYGYARSAGAAQKAIERGQAPPGIERVDKRDTNIPGSQDEVHVNGGAINRDGSIKHKLDTPLTNAQKKWMGNYGFRIPAMYR